MTDDRPNPDDLLARVQAEEARAQRGKLRIFFGYAAGVGKTFAMLSAARREREAGAGVVVGYVEPHGRPETEALLAGLEALPTRAVEYRGVTLREFDLDGALERRPQIILVDELAHTNAEGLRHTKRWQDVEELLDAGIDVWTTLNVQHIESLNDVIAQITGVVVRETLPDAVLERADEIELIDLTPDGLMERLKAGKVYIPHQAERALGNFFQRGNLVALRELSLRQAAHRLQRDVEAARLARAAAGPWATSEKLLVCVGPSPSSLRIIRSAKRMAVSLGAEWLAVAVDTRRAGRKAKAMYEQTSQHLRMAEQLGAETHVLVGDSVADAVMDFAHARNVTKIVVGKTAQPTWKRVLARGVVDQLIDRSGDIDVYVVSGEGEAPAPPRQLAPEKQTIDWRKYGIAAVIVAVCAILGWTAHWLTLSETNIVMIFLAGVVLIAARLGRGPAIAAAVAGVLVFDFLFVTPYWTFAVTDTEYLITFAVMLGIGLLISELTARLKSQLQASQEQELRTGQLFRMTRQLSELSGTEFLIGTAAKQLADIFAGEIVLYLREADGSLSLRMGQNTSIAAVPMNTVVAQWVAQNEKVAGAGTDTLPNATALFVPLIGSLKTVGVLGLRPADGERLLDPDQHRLLETCASLIALSIERDESVLSAYQAQLQVQAEQLRNSLLSSVSHDLRTPLATITGTASSLLETAPADDAQQREMLQAVVDESSRLSRLVDNLLDMARLESGSVVPNRQWHVLEELVGSALGSLKRELKRHPVQVRIPQDFPLLYIDGVLLEQVLVNLLENASRYTPGGTQLEISARQQGNRVEIHVADNGPGLPPGSESKIFDKFFRGATVSADGRRGVGLGLTICQAIVQAHGGRITAANHSPRGAEFVISLPNEQQPPPVTVDEIPASVGA